MSRIRTIKPEFWTSEQVVECSTTARLLFIGIWNFADDRGVLPASIRQLKMLVFPGDDFTVGHMTGFVKELVSQGLLAEFEGDDGREYWAVTGWKHQKIEKPNYKYPAPPAEFSDQSPNNRRPVADKSPTPRPRIGREGKGKERKGKDLRVIGAISEIADPAPVIVASPTAPPDAPPIPAIGTSEPPAPAIPAIPKRAGPAETTGTRLPADWVLPADWEAWSLAEQPTWTAPYCRRIADSFRDYWIGMPGARGRKSNWLATWRNWVRREGQMKPAITGGKSYVTARGGTAYVPAAVSAVQGNLAILAQYGMTAGDGPPTGSTLEGEFSHACTG